MKPKVRGLLYDGCRFLIAIDCASPVWRGWVRYHRHDYHGRLRNMMNILRELNGGTDLADKAVQPEVTPAMCLWWADAQNFLEGIQ